MKKSFKVALALILTFSLFSLSCSNEEIETIEVNSLSKQFQEQLSKGKNCLMVNPNRFTVDTYTYGVYNQGTITNCNNQNSNLDCFIKLYNT